MFDGVGDGRRPGHWDPRPSSGRAGVHSAKELDSVVIPGRKMFLSELIEVGAWPKDSVVLMERHYPVTAANTTYGKYDANGNRIAGATPEDGQRALNDMNAALAQGKAVTIAINNNSLYSSRPGWTPSSSNPDFTTYDHQIQVLKIDVTNGKVWVNDSALATGGQEFSLSAVMKAWQVSDYDLTVVSVKATYAGAGEVGVWRIRCRAGDTVDRFRMWSPNGMSDPWRCPCTVCSSGSGY